ncbi:MAG: dihydroorotase [Methanoregula sp.]|nr:MAG: dihydroorotase [Methanoregula sp.]
MMTGRTTLVLSNVTLPDGRVADISSGGGYVTHIGSAQSCDRIIDCTGLLALPGAIDMHVHMRGGKQSAKEDWQTGSQSALAGGVTVVVDQPNTVPPVTSPMALQDRVQDAKEHSLCHFGINSGVNAKTSLEMMWQAGALAFGEIFFAPSSYGEAIGKETLIQVFERISSLGALATIHAEMISPVPDQDLRSHDRARSSDGETEAVRTVNQCNRSRCRVHFCHLSSSASIEAASGSVEVTPHHLFLSQDSFDPSSAFGKVNPPLRTENQRRDLWKRWERIDVIASDHAPHTADEKHTAFPDAPAGIPGVETMMPLLVAKVIERKISVLSLAKKTSFTPANLLGIPKAGFSIGNRADYALFPKSPVRITIDTLHSKCGWTPYEDQMAVFPDTVIMGGEPVYHKREFLEGSPAWFPGAGYRYTGQ